MSDSTSLLTQLTTAQAGKEATVNELMNAVSQAAFGGRKQSSSGLSWDYFGGRIDVDGVTTAIANGTVTLTASTTNYVESTRAGVVSKNTTGFTAGNIALYKIVTGTATVTSYEDHRPWVKLQAGKLARSITSDANITLTHDESENNVLEFTSSVSLTVTRDVIVPLSVKSWIIYNNTTGGQSLRFIGASGTGATVASGAWAIICGDGTNVSLITSTAGSQPYDTGAFYPGLPPTSAITLIHVFNRAVTFLSALSGSHGVAGTAATAQTDFDIQKNGSSFGTMRFAASATTATFIAASASSFVAGDILKIIAPATPDATLANISFTLAGTR